MKLDLLTAISPIDGRYRGKAEALAAYFSEFALIKYRVQVEVEYFIALCELPLPQLKGIDKGAFETLRNIYRNFTEADAQRIKDIESVTNHDVKAVEYFLKEEFDKLGGMDDYKEFIHFGLTSQDINNTSVPLSIKEALDQVYYPLIGELITQLRTYADEWENVPMLAKTHGQPASPTRLGKEIRVFVYRLEKISLRGLKGGHSGVQIHLGHANANKLMNRFLKEVVSDYEARIASINGGSLRNAIPRESFVVLTIPEQLSEDLVDLVAEYEQLFRDDYSGVENGISFKAERTEMPESLFPEEVQDDLINAVEACHNGVVSYLADFPGVVESSLNLALVQSAEGVVEIKLLVRSSSESLKDWICSSLESLFNLAGAKVEFGGDYPGWQPDANSELLDQMVKLYIETYNERPTIMVIHAGLECGIIQSNVEQKLDIVSFGPTITGAHSPDEAVNIETVGKSYDYLVSVLENLK